MEQPMTLHWQVAERYYTAALTPDLFGGWMLVTASGRSDSRAGRVSRKAMASYQHGLDAIRRLRHRRRREGYDLCTASFAEFERFDSASPDLRAAESNSLARLFAIWGVTANEQCRLLAIDAKTLEGYLDGRPLADDAGLLSRVQHLLAIQKALRLSYGHDTEVVRRWLRTPRTALAGQTPLAAMLAAADGLPALRRHLDQQTAAARGCAQT
jgi:hypothetical protein